MSVEHKPHNLPRGDATEDVSLADELPGSTRSADSERSVGGAIPPVPNQPVALVRKTLYEVAAVMRGMMSDDAITARILLDPEIAACEQAIQALDRLVEQLEALRRENKALYAEMARLPNRQAAEAFGRVREYVSVGALCGDPCPEAPDLPSCLLPEGHDGEWHQNRSSSWPVSSPASEPESA